MPHQTFVLYFYICDIHKFKKSPLGYLFGIYSVLSSDTASKPVSPNEVPVSPLPESSVPDTSEENAEPSAASVNESDESMLL